MARKIIGIDYDAHDDCYFALDLTKSGHELIAVRSFVLCLFVPLPTTVTTTTTTSSDGDNIATNPGINTIESK